MPELKKNPTLAEFQQYVYELEIERGFADQNAQTKCLLLGEEIGELFKLFVKPKVKLSTQSQKLVTLAMS
ncbi:hypothetical protein [Photobacterium kasasachensis]|uniref:hypothetical protein n=1 Tax=Photobacterium kasasachensis TaxID=2910240 RepID=UPI003D14BDCD